MTADGFHSLSDGSSNVVGLIGIWLAAKPMDKEHPYGHKKFEVLAGLFIGIMLAYVGIRVLLDTLIKFIHPVIPEISLQSIITLLITLVINIFVSRYEYNRGKMYNSKILISDSLHTKSDIYVSLGVLITLICINLGLPSIIDTIVSVVIALFIFHAAYEILRDNSGVLLDKVVVDSEIIKNVVLEFSEVKDIHKIRSRGMFNELYIDLHIMTNPEMSVEDSHNLIHNIENKIREKICENTQVAIHLEPYYPKL
jgi:cation diffusion facilitator family transporter